MHQIEFNCRPGRLWTAPRRSPASCRARWSHWRRRSERVASPCRSGSRLEVVWKHVNGSGRLRLRAFLRLFRQRNFWRNHLFSATWHLWRHEDDLIESISNLVPEFDVVYKNGIELRIWDFCVKIVRFCRRALTWEKLSFCLQLLITFTVK